MRSPSRSTGRSTDRCAALLATALLALLASAGCSGSDEAEFDLGERTPLPAEQPALWNPCDGLETGDVETAFDTSFTLSRGTDTEPRCTFAPEQEGGPAVDVNYQQFVGSLDELFTTFGILEEGTETAVETVEVPDADDARIVVDTDRGTLLVSGFVQNGPLVQLVNVVDPSPFRRDRAADAVRDLLGDLATHAADSGLRATESPDADPEADADADG